MMARVGKARGQRTRAAAPLAAACLLPTLLAAGCGPGSGAGGAPPSVFIYLVDTLRPDHLGPYGYDRGTTPALDAFARDAVVFENAYTPAAWTRPATASLLTGLLPPDHGAVTKLARIPAEVELAGEYLRPLGYETAAFVANVNVIEKWGFDQGFDHFVDVNKGPGKPRAEELLDLALEHLERLGDGPVLFYVHALDPHGPYRPPAPFDELGRAGRGKVVHPRDLDGTVGERDLRATVDAYDGEIAYTDQQFGRFLQHLRDSGRYDDALVVFVSDHGEEFLEHGEGGHAHTLYEELVRVPLIVKFPRGQHAGRRVAGRASLIDVLPTVLAASGAARPEALPGTDLARAAAGDSSLDGRPLFFDLDVYRSDGTVRILDGVLDGPLKLIRHTAPDVSAELFELERDPDEQRNLAGELPGEVERLGRLVEATRPADRAGIVVILQGDGRAEARVFEGELRTDGTFGGLETRGLEEEDRVWLEPGDQVLRWRVVSRSHKKGNAVQLRTDADEFSFQLLPGDAGFTAQTCREGQGDPVPLFLGPARKPAGPARSFRPDSPEIAVEASAFGRWRAEAREGALPSGAYLLAVQRKVEEAEFDEEDLERLRALGYVR